MTAAAIDRSETERERQPGMNPRLAGAIVVAAVGLTLLGLWLPGVAPYPRGASMQWTFLSYAANLAMIGAGLVAWSRRPGSKVGRLTGHRLRQLRVAHRPHPDDLDLAHLDGLRRMPDEGPLEQ